MDQRLVAHPVYSKFFPSIDARELAQFGAAQAADGSILHFDADIYAGLTGRDGVAPTAGNEYHDNVRDEGQPPLIMRRFFLSATDYHC